MTKYKIHCFFHAWTPLRSAFHLPTPKLPLGWGDQRSWERGYASIHWEGARFRRVQPSQIQALLSQQLITFIFSKLQVLSYLRPHLGGALQISSREKYTQSSRVGPCGHGNLSQSSGIADWCPGPTRESYDLCMRLRWCTNEDSTGELMKNGKKAKHNWYKRTNRYHQFKEV